MYYCSSCILPHITPNDVQGGVYEYYMHVLITLLTVSCNVISLPVTCIVYTEVEETMTKIVIIFLYVPC